MQLNSKKYKIFSYLIKKITLKKKFHSFPNPHIRTSSFLIYGQLLLDYMINKNIKSKENTWEIESGKMSLTSFFKQKNYPVYIVNSDGKSLQKLIGCTAKLIVILNNQNLLFLINIQENIYLYLKRIEFHHKLKFGVSD